MTRSRRPSAQTILVLSALAEDSATWRYGYELGRQVDLRAGSLYPILIRLRDRGLLEASWEDDPSAGRPPRHLYRLTSDGVRQAAELTGARTAERAGERPGERATERPGERTGDRAPARVTGRPRLRQA